MEISVLATKCRFCGESVGRPRDETRSLSIDDLGGETIRHYAPSSSVMEAMEAFRSEHDFKSNPPEDAQPERKSLFGMASKKKGGAGGAGGAEGLPQLDERSQALASLALPTTKPTVFKKPKGPSMATRVMQIGGILVGVAVLLFIANFAYRQYTKPPVEPNRAKANRAEAMIKRGEDPKLIVIEAAQAERVEPHSKNEAILKEARGLFMAKIHKYLDAAPWTHQALKNAAREVDEVFKVDSGSEMRQLKEEVDAETFAYQMSLLEVGDANGRATFGLSSGGRQDAKVGDIVGDRFKVTAIKRDKVQVEDTRRNNRPLTYSLTDTRITSP